jgi:glutaredoxin
MYILYSTVNCSACQKAKELLISEGYEHQVKILNVHFNIIDLYKVAPRNIKSFPVITKLVNGEEEYLGGLKELRISVEKGGL